MMLTKRAAIVAIFSGVLAKMVHADDPDWKAATDNSHGISMWDGPTVWTVNLNQLKRLDVVLDGQTITVLPIEIMAALKG